MSADRILLVDNDLARRDRLNTLVEFLGYHRIVNAAFGQWELLAGDAPLVILLAGENDGFLREEFLKLTESFPRVPVILFSTMPGGFSSEGSVIAHFGYAPGYHELVTALHRAEIGRESQCPEAGTLSRVLIGSSPAIRNVRRLVEQVANSEANVLVLGESGTGKEVVARSLHLLSLRRDNAFIPVNCGAIPADLLESELFGHEKGAFTGALTSRQGRFEVADGGTLFLDEIGDMPLPMQVKLLRVIQERTFERVGSSKSISTDVRIIAATHRDLEESITRGLFREDLFFRLNVFPIEVPPLRERREDIPLLINELLARLEREQRGVIRLTPAAIASLQLYPWPGNVRELANLMERLVIMFPNNMVGYSDLPQKFQMAGVEEAGPVFPVMEVPQSDFAPYTAPAEPILALPRDGLKEYIGSIELALIQQALREADGVVAHAAQRLKMRRTTLVEKIRKYGLQRTECESSPTF